MERLSKIIFLLIVFFSCQESNNKKEVLSSTVDSSLDNMMSTVIHHDVNILSDMREYIEYNHLEDPCANESLIIIVKIYDYIEATQNAVESKVGGIDENGIFIKRDDDKVFKMVLKELDFFNNLNQMIADLENSLNDDFKELIIESVKKDIRPFQINSYDNSTFANIYLDMVIVKSNLINTEVKYFELLKNKVDCDSTSNS